MSARRQTAHRMRISIGSLVVLSISLILNAPQSQAIFGLSTCEKTKSAILSEEKIGYQLWLSWNATRVAWTTKHVVLQKQDANTLMNLLLPLFQSDANVYKIAMKAPKCFKPSQDATIRTEANTTNTEISGIQKYTTNPYAQVIPMKIFTGEYTAYYSVYGNKITS